MLKGRRNDNIDDLDVLLLDFLHLDNFLRHRTFLHATDAMLKHTPVCLKKQSNRHSFINTFIFKCDNPHRQFSDGKAPSFPVERMIWSFIVSFYHPAAPIEHDFMPAIIIFYIVNFNLITFPMRQNSNNT